MINARFLSPAPAREWKDKNTGELRSMPRWALLVETPQGAIAVNMIQPREFTAYPKPGSQVLLGLQDRDGDLFVKIMGVQEPK